MNVQGMPPVSASANNMSVAGRPPMLGAQVPGTTGGLPAQGGLSVAKNPMAEQLQGYGRNGDSMLVHMTPGEVGGLQQLAMAMGGSLTTNPDTGLPEANILKKLLPTLLGAGLSFIPGVGPLAAAGIIGAGQTALTGDIRKGLLAGLGAFGGASLAGAAVPNLTGGAASKIGMGAALPDTTGTAANIGAGVTGTPGISGAAAKLASTGVPASPFGLGNFGGSMLPIDVGVGTQGFGTLGTPVAAAKKGLAGFAQRFGAEAAGGLSGAAAKYAPYAAGFGVLNSLSGSQAPLSVPQEEYEFPMQNYEPLKRRLQPRELTPGGEIQFFDVTNPVPPPPAPRKKTGRGFADGGEVAGVGDIALDPQMAQTLADYTRMFQTSPGAITASMGYPGGSPSERLRAGARETDFGLGRSITGTFNPSLNIMSGTGGETLPTSLSSANTNSGGGANFMDLANMYGGRMTSEIASGPPSNNPLPGTTIPSVDVSGEGIMPDFKLDPLTVNPVGMPQINVSSGYGTGDSMGGYRGEFGGSSPFSGDMGGSLNSMGSFGNNLDSRISGGNYTFPTATFESSSPFSISSPFGGMGSIYGGEFGGGSVFKDPEDYVEEKARGGEVGMEDGSFVIDARTVSELGNGSSNAGIEHLARMGGRPVRGGGDGVSDSVPARIGGHQKARVARDEVIFSPEAVSRLGSGSHSKGTKKLYALMGKAHSARKKAGRGQDTKVAKGLTALNGRTN
jgi:hypothetical protein